MFGRRRDRHAMGSDERDIRARENTNQWSGELSVIIGESGEKWTVGRNGPPLFSGKLMDKMCQ